VDNLKAEEIKLRDHINGAKQVYSYQCRVCKFVSRNSKN